MTTNLTPQEAQLVLDLISLFNATENEWWIDAHNTTCRCGVCKAMDSIGIDNAPTFDSLSKKCSESATKP